VMPSAPCKSSNAGAVAPGSTPVGGNHSTAMGLPPTVKPGELSALAVVVGASAGDGNALERLRRVIAGERNN
jgi:hypothetical protein